MNMIILSYDNDSCFFVSLHSEAAEACDENDYEYDYEYDSNNVPLFSPEGI